MKNFVTIALMSLFLVNKASTKDYKLTCGDYTVVLKLEDYRFSGTYKSFYKNGETRAEGDLLNGYRFGKWLLYDSLGTIISNRSFNEFGKVKIENDVFGFNTKPNNLDFADYDELNQSTIIFSKRLWSMVPRTHNENLFAIKWNKMLLNWYKNGSAKLYSGVSDELTSEFDPKRIEKILGFECDEIRIKEDFFYDKNRKISEYRIIAIGFDFYVGKEEPETIWLYYPEIRPLLAKISSGKIESLEHLFFVRDFYSLLYKESNVKNKNLNEYVQESEITTERLRIFCNLFEAEHEAWKN